MRSGARAFSPSAELPEFDQVMQGTPISGRSGQALFASTRLIASFFVQLAAFGNFTSYNATTIIRHRKTQIYLDEGGAEVVVGIC